MAALKAKVVQSGTGKVYLMKCPIECMSTSFTNMKPPQSIRNLQYMHTTSELQTIIGIIAVKCTSVYAERK